MLGGRVLWLIQIHSGHLHWSRQHKPARPAGDDASVCRVSPPLRRDEAQMYCACWSKSPHAPTQRLLPNDQENVACVVQRHSFTSERTASPSASCEFPHEQKARGSDEQRCVSERAIGHSKGTEWGSWSYPLCTGVSRWGAASNSQQHKLIFRDVFEVSPLPFFQVT